MSDPILTVATWNIHACVGTDGRSDPSRIAGVLAELDASIIGLQEVETTNSSPPDALRRFAESRDMHWTFGRTRDGRNGKDFGNALLTTSPPVRVGHLDLSVSSREPRGAIAAVLEPLGNRIGVLCTHLGLRRRERARQVETIRDAIWRSEPDIAVLLGDLNEWNPRRAAWRLRMHELGLELGHRPTWPSWFPMLSLDTVCVRPRGRLLDLRVHRSARAREASDHLPVVADVDVG